VDRHDGRPRGVREPAGAGPAHLADFDVEVDAIASQPFGVSGHDEVRLGFDHLHPGPLDQQAPPPRPGRGVPLPPRPTPAAAYPHPLLFGVSGRGRHLAHDVDLAPAPGLRHARHLPRGHLPRVRPAALHRHRLGRPRPRPLDLHPAHRPHRRHRQTPPPLRRGPANRAASTRHQHPPDHPTPGFCSSATTSSTRRPSRSAASRPRISSMPSQSPT